MSEALFAVHGALVALTGVFAFLAWKLATEAERHLADIRKEAACSLEDVRNAASEMAQAHNDLVKVQAEQGNKIAALEIEVAGRQLRR